MGERVVGAPVTGLPVPGESVVGDRVVGVDVNGLAVGLSVPALRTTTNAESVEYILETNLERRLEIVAT